MLALTSSGVEDVTLIDPAELDRLATWLCETDEYHARLYNNSTSDASFTEQFNTNGFCNKCCDHAGEILAFWSEAEKA